MGKKVVKIILLFAVLMLLYFLPALLFPSQPEYYRSLNQPFYAPPAILFAIMWPILYVIFALYLAVKYVNRTLSKEQMIYFVVNYLIGFFFNFVFFQNKNLFLTFGVTFFSFITGLFIAFTAYKEDTRQGLIFVPYLLWTFYASILMAHIYLIN